MTFIRVSPHYSTLSGCALDRIMHADELGVYMDPKLKFSDNITTMVNKARGVLAFIKRWSKEFYDPYVTKTLFILLVRPILEYCAPVWSSQHGVHIDRIEYVQNNFLIFALRRLNWDTGLKLPCRESRVTGSPAF